MSASEEQRDKHRRETSVRRAAHLPHIPADLSLVLCDSQSGGDYRPSTTSICQHPHTTWQE